MYIYLPVNINNLEILVQYDRSTETTYLETARRAGTRFH